MTAQVPAGEYRCDFFDFGCGFVFNGPQSETQHYESPDGRHEHIRLVSDKLRNLQQKVDRLKRSVRQNQQELRRKQLEIDELKRKLHRLGAHCERVISVFELSIPDLLAENAGWHSCLTQQFGYGLDIQARFLESLTGAVEFRFRLRLRPTPHDRTLQWPFRSTVRVAVFPPDGQPQLQEGSSATLVPKRLPANQLRLLDRPDAAGDEERESIEIRAPTGLSRAQLLGLPDGSSFAARVVLLPEEAE
ncbi:hypothetical protein BOX15_Mlig012345g1 [Macrostomum lignano]|uniref:Uncharacterized protein n=1 Tax=Macrostomum lignano TaxID=282301 RepID=A0A267G9U1_9PLAT|nr:hypothetical protein BOX15_Mlig012345g1 [Macrostomum lignano]